MTSGDPIVEVIGKDSFGWLSREFNKETTLSDLPYEILDRISPVDMTIRDYASDRKAITAIAVITFAYRMANKTQKASSGSKDILLLKVLAKNEKSKGKEKTHVRHRLWDAPLFSLITGHVGERIRATRTMDSRNSLGL